MYNSPVNRETTFKVYLYHLLFYIVFRPFYYLFYNLRARALIVFLSFSLSSVHLSLLIYPSNGSYSTTTPSAVKYELKKYYFFTNISPLSTFRIENRAEIFQTARVGCSNDLIKVLLKYSFKSQ